MIEAFTHEATGGQLNIDSTVDDFESVDMDRVHTLTGPIFVDDAEVGDVLAVELLELEPGDWAWTGMSPHFGFLGNENQETVFKTYKLDKQANLVHFADGIDIPMKPFAGVMGVAPDTDEMLTTIPPRANGGNMDDPNIGAGVTVYFPVFVEGALFSIGDTHAVQGMGEVVGTAVEAPMRILFRVSVMKDRSIEEPQYETDDYYATTGLRHNHRRGRTKSNPVHDQAHGRHLWPVEGRSVHALFSYRRSKNSRGRGFAPCAGNNAYSQRRLCIPFELMPDTWPDTQEPR